MLQLREYQLDGINELSTGWKLNTRQVLALTTGGGKTVIFTEIAKRATERNKRVLILTHRTELFEQAKKTFGKVGLDPELINAKSKNVNVDKLLFISMVETITRRTQLIQEIKPDLIIIDECHIGNFTKVLDLYPDTFTLGVTATPVGKHFFTHYSKIVQTIDTPDLVDSGFLVPCIPYQMVSKIDGLKTKAGEYTDASMMDFYDKSILYNGVVENYKQFALNKKSLIFNCNIQHSETMCQTFLDAGIECKSLTSKNTSEERTNILHWFENTTNAVLCNAGILTAGYDHPPIECIIVNRATKSLPLWLQMVGRGSRIFENKKEFILLDFGANHNNHGLWNDYRKWTLNPPKEKKENEMPVKTCNQCSAMVNVSALICPHCNYIFTVKKKELQHGEMQLVVGGGVIGKFLNDLTLEDLLFIAKSKNKYNLKTTMIWRICRSRGIDFLKAFGKEMNYRNGWYFMQKEQMEDIKFNNIKVKLK